MKLSITLLTILTLLLLNGCTTTTSVSTGVVVYDDPFPHTVIYYSPYYGYRYHWDNHPRYLPPPHRPVYHPHPPIHR
jgi:hypothetical protein